MFFTFLLMLAVAGLVYYVQILQERLKGGGTPVKNRQNMTEHSQRFYLNVEVENYKEVLRNLVPGKIAERAPRAVLLQKAAGALASRMVSDEKFGELVGGKISEKIPDRLGEQGITARGQMVFHRQCFVVIEIIIDHVDLKKLIELKQGEDTVQQLDAYVKQAGNISEGAVAAAANAIDGIMTKKIQEKMISIIPTVMQEKMGEKVGMKAKIVANPEYEQAAFFFNTLNALHLANESSEAAEPAESKKDA